MYESEVSTSPKGDKQPGAFAVEWVELQHSDKKKGKVQERCADVIAYNKTKHHHTIVVEIKSDDRSAQSQLTGQMCGLFDPLQKFMLGLDVHPQLIKPLMMVKTEESLDLFPMREIEHLQRKGLRKLAALILSTSREVSEQ